MLHDGKNWIAGANRIIAYLEKTVRNDFAHVRCLVARSSIDIIFLTYEGI